MITNIGLWFFTQSPQQIDSFDYNEYSSLKANYDKKVINDSLETIKVKIDEISLYEQFEVYKSLPDFALNKKDFYNPIFNDINFIIEYESIKKIDVWSEKNLYSELYNYYNLLNDYPSYVQQVRKNIGYLKNQPIWSLYSNSKMEYYHNLDEMYAELSDVKPISINYISFEKLLLFNSNIILLIVGVYIFFMIFNIEEKEQMNELLLVLPNGRTKTTIHKLLLLIAVMICIGVVVSILEIFITQSLFGSINWNAPVQSVPSLVTVPYNISLINWYLLRILFQTLGVTVLSLLFGMFYYIFKNRKIGIFFYTLMLIIGAITYLLISDNMSISWIKYLNPFVLTQLSFLLKEYRSFDIWEYSISLASVVSILIITLLIFSIAIIIKKRVALTKLEWSLKLKTMKSNHEYFEKLGIYGHELHKLLIVQKGWFIIVLVFIMQGYFTYQTVSNISSFENQRQLAEYYFKHGGQLDQEKINWIEDEYLKYQQLQNNLVLASNNYQTNRISEYEYYMIVDKYIEQSNEKSIFLEFYDHYQRLNSENLIYPNGYQALFSMNTPSRDSRNSLIMMIGLIFLLSPIVSQDAESNLGKLFKITKYGNLSLRLKRIKIGVIVSICSVLIFTFIELIAFSYLYNMVSWNSLMIDILPMNFIINNHNILNLALWQYYVILIIIRIFAATLLAMLIMSFSIVSRSIVISYLFSISVIFIPIVFRYFGTSAFEIITLDRLMMGNVYLYAGINFFSVISFAVVYSIAYVFLLKFDLE